MIEFECGVPFPGCVLPRDQWSLAPDPGPPQVVDVGCGNGRYLIGSALARPHLQHLGVDRVTALIASAERRSRQRGLTNVRFVAGDAREWMPRLSGLLEVHLYHPQPYSGKVDEECPVLTPVFFEAMWKSLRPDGLLCAQSDSKRCWTYLVEAARNHFDVEIVEGPWPDAPEGRTRREIVARRKGLAIRRLIGRRLDRPREIAPTRPYFTKISP